ncbi:hypothetical protein QZH41_009803, partial [Actinostola sp. cb2023]
NREGRVFPIWAECLGLELIALLVAGIDVKQGGQQNKELFSLTDSKNFSTTLKLYDIKSSVLFSNTPKRLQKFMASKAFAYNNHIVGMTPKTFNRYNKLKSMFHITSTSNDRLGQQFISTMEGRRYPFFLFHWHPSKPQFEWSEGLDIFHSPDAVRLVQQLFGRFVDK